ncbi:MAG: gliding motility-associated C-terminal domain-containing protein [Bacteroidota bacterium]
MKILLVFSFCLFISVAGFSQLQVSITPPLYVSPCGGPYEYKVDWSVGPNTSIANGQLTFFLPAGLEYKAGSLVGSGIIEFDITNQGAPVFSWPNPLDYSSSFLFKVTSSCDLSAIDSNIQDSILVSHDFGADLFFGPKYNLNKHFLDVQSPFNLDVLANVGDTLFRGVEIINKGFSQVSQLIITDDHNAADLEVLSVSVGTILSHNPLSILLSGDDFQHIGDGDSVFENDETIQFREELLVLRCESIHSSLRFILGCDSFHCETFADISAIITPENNYPHLDAVFLSESYAGPCQDGEIVVAMINSGNEVTLGAATAFNVELDLGAVLNFSNYPSIDHCLRFSDFSLGNAPQVVIDSFSGNGFLLKCSQFTFDPDGPGGLFDGDGDGEYDDLAVGDSFLVRFNTSFDGSCLPQTCSEEFQRRRVMIRSACLDQCAQVQTFADTHPRYYYDSDFSNSTDQVTYSAADSTLTVKLFIDGNMFAIDSACSSSSIRIGLVLPEIIKVLPGFAPLMDQTAMQYSFTADTLWLYGDDLEGEVQLSFSAICDSIQITDPDLPCGGIIAPPSSTYSIPYQIEYICSDSCSDPVTVLCEETREFALLCPIPSSQIGILVSEKEMKRKNLGYKDSTCLEKVTSLTPGLALNVLMSGDTVIAMVKGEISGDGTFTESSFQTTYINFTEDEYLQFLTGTLSFFDSETGDLTNCPVTVVDSVFYQGGEHGLVFFIDKLLETGSCLEGYNLSDGDNIWFEALYLITDKVPTTLFTFPQVRSNFVYEYDNDDQYACGGQVAQLTVFKPDYRFNFRSESSKQGCDTLSLQYELIQVSGIEMDDPFPYEYRPHVNLDSLTVRIPDWMMYVPGSSSFSFDYRPQNEPSAPVQQVQVPLPDPAVLPAGNETILVFRGDSFPCIDLITVNTIASLHFNVVPSCMPTSTTYLSSTKYFDQQFYLEGGREKIQESKQDAVNYSTGAVSMTATNPLFEGLSKIANWMFQLRLNSYTTDFLPHAWLVIDLPPNSSIAPFALKEIIAGDTLYFPLEPFGNGEDFMVKIDTLFHNRNRIFEICALFESCEPNQSFDVRFDFDCSGFPANLTSYDPVCPKSLPSMSLLLSPKEALVLINLVESPPPPIPLCEKESFSLKCINNMTGAALHPVVSIYLPAEGMYLVPGSCQLKIGTGNYIPIDDPVQVPGTNQFYWDLTSYLPEIPGSELFPDNQLWLDFQSTTDCLYDPNSAFSYDVNWSDVCDNEQTSPLFHSLPIQLENAPESLNDFDLEIAPLTVSGCGQSSTLSVSVINHGGSPDDLTSNLERIILHVPSEFEYVAGSFQNLLNFPLNIDPIIFEEGNFQVLEWVMPDGLGIGDSVLFQIDVMALDTGVLACGQLPIVLETVERTGIPCSSAPSGFCFIDFQSSIQTFSIEVVKPSYSFEVLKASAYPTSPTSELWEIEFSLSNLSQISAGIGFLDFSVFLDINQNGLFDAGTDLQLASIPQHVDGMQPGQTLQSVLSFNVPSESGCNGLLVVLDTVQNDCICNFYEFFIPPVPITNTVNDTTICSGSFIPLGVAGQEGYLYNWSGPIEFIDDVEAANPTYNRALSPGATETDVLVLTTTRPTGCISYDSVTVTVTNLHTTLQVNQPIACHQDNNGAIELIVEGGFAPYQINWTDNPQIDSLQRTALPAGEYSVEVTSFPGCTDSSTIVLTEPPELASYGITEPATCYGGDDGAIHSFVDGGTPPYTYEWSIGSNSPILFDLVAGTYDLIVTDAHNCVLVVSFEVQQPPAPDPDIKISDISCLGASDGSIEVVPPTGGVFLFNLNGGVFQSEPSFSNLTTGSYVVGILNDIGCDHYFEVELTAPYQSLVDTPPDTTIFIGDSIKIDPSYHFSVDSIIWKPDHGLSCQDCHFPWAKPFYNTLYIVEVSNPNNCIDKDSILIKVRGNIYFPSAFSPNGDGKNDHFYGFSKKGAVFINSLQVFDRWGNMVFSNLNIEPNNPAFGWDGTFEGEPMNPAVFVYEAVVTYINGETELMVGDLTLIK